jgi:UDP-glucose:glycoprotein glucosyltransferase
MFIIFRTFTRPSVFSFDHVYPPPASVKARPPRTAILYAALESENFRELHSHLISVASRQRHHVEYILRYVPQEMSDNTEKNYLTGYGVGLDLKKMEYSAVDDRLKFTGWPLLLLGESMS